MIAPGARPADGLTCEGLSIKRKQKFTPHPFAELTEFGVGIDTEGMIAHMQANGWDPSERITV